MHALSDTLGPGSCTGAQARAADALRDHMLGLTSALRVGLDRLAGQRGDAAALAALRGAGRAIVAAGARAELAAVVRCAEGFCDLAVDPGVPESATTVDRLLAAVGRIEQVLDGCLAGIDGERLGRLCDGVAARELGIDADDDAIALAAAPGGGARASWEVDLRPGPAAARPPHEQELVDAFVAEALDVLDECESQLLRCELEPAGAAAVLAAVGADLETIADAGAAVGVTDLDAPSSSSDVDALLEGIDAMRRGIEAAWTDSGAAAVDPQTSLPLDELFLRLRRVARDVAHRAGGLIAFDTHGGELRISAALADRVYEPLAQMIGDAAAHGAPGTRRTLRLRAEGGGGMLSLAVADSAREHAGVPADAEQAEALHWIDARQPASDDETARLVYRHASVNVVQIITG